MRLGIFYCCLNDTNVPDILEVQALKVGIEVQKCPKKDQDTVKNAH